MNGVNHRSLNHMCILPFSGLQLVLNVKQGEYIPQIDAPVGGLTLIHAQKDVPFPQDDGILIKPGTLLTIGIRKVCGFCSYIHGIITLNAIYSI